MRVKVKDIRFCSLSGRPFSTKTVEELKNLLNKFSKTGTLESITITNQLIRIPTPPVPLLLCFVNIGVRVRREGKGLRGKQCGGVTSRSSWLLY